MPDPTSSQAAAEAAARECPGCIECGPPVVVKADEGCDGSGWVSPRNECEVCEGFGYDPNDYPCSACDGTGKQPPRPATLAPIPGGGRSRVREVLDGIAAAQREVELLCDGKRWQMTIPVDLKRDSDVIIGNALRKGADEIKRLTAELDAS